MEREEVRAALVDLPKGKRVKLAYLLLLAVQDAVRFPNVMDAVTCAHVVYRDNWTWAPKRTITIQIGPEFLTNFAVFENYVVSVVDMLEILD
jgi:hypothetical protein